MFSGTNRTTLQRRRGAGAAFPLLLAAAVLVGVAAAGPESGPASDPAAVRAGPTTRRVTLKGWFAVPVVQRPPLPKKVTKTFVIPIHDDPIDGNTQAAVQRKVTQCKGKGADLVIFDMDTPGGELRATSKIMHLILKDLKDIRTVAYVNPRASSAGALISITCDEIVVCDHSRLGTSMPIMAGPTGIIPIPHKERGKLESDLRAQARAAIRDNAYDKVLCEGMITIIWEIWLIKNRQTGELSIVRARDWRHRVAKAPPSTQPGVAAIKPPPDAPWTWVETIVDSNELVTLTDEEALRYGFVEHRFETMEDLKKHYNVTGEVTFLGDSASEKFVAFLTSQGVTMLLMMGMIFFAYTEMNTPGFGVAGGIAIACLAVLVAARFLVGLANAIEISALIIGLVLIGLEIFVTPGFGVLGISGVVIVLASLAAMAVPNAPDRLPVPQTDLDWSILEEGLAAMLIGAVLAT
ncbi:MAG: hypothetical protein ISS78_03885, partial [Phycisphaerae bacterium]|nr:hypothetical protein [Phycisphaerae bacterium]